MDLEVKDEFGSSSGSSTPKKKATLESLESGQDQNQDVLMTKHVFVSRPAMNQVRSFV